MSPTAHRNRVRIVVAVLSGLLLAGSALVAAGGTTAWAQPQPSALTLGPPVRYAPPGGVRWVAGRLTAAGGGVAYVGLTVERLGTTGWVAEGSTHTWSDGTYSFRVAPRSTSAYRARFAGTEAVGPSTSPVARVTTVRYAFPVRGRASYGRTHAEAPATDIFAACGTRVVSPVDGVVLQVNRVDRFVRSRPNGAWKGGRFLSVWGDDGVRHYGSHLQWIWGALRPGVRVAAGQVLATVGRTGNASNICHLHYALSPVCARTTDWWVRRGAVYPWPFLDQWRVGRWVSPHDAVAAWQHAHGCPRHP